MVHLLAGSTTYMMNDYTRFKTLKDALHNLKKKLKSKKEYTIRTR